MKDTRFYLEFPNRRTKKLSGREHIGHSGNVFALFLNDGYRHSPEGLGAIFKYANSPVASTGADWGWISEHCKRIPEAVAREIHPKLFERLD